MNVILVTPLQICLRCCAEWRARELRVEQAVKRRCIQIVKEFPLILRNAEVLGAEFIASAVGLGRADF